MQDSTLSGNLALSGRLKSESMWTILSQAPLKQSQHTNLWKVSFYEKGDEGNKMGQEMKKLSKMWFQRDPDPMGSSGA